MVQAREMDLSARSVARFRKFLPVAALVLASLLAAVALASCKREVEQLGIKLTLDRRTLPNGLSVVMVENHTVPVVTYQSWFRVGSVDEEPGLTGVSHLFEHLMFKGTNRYGPKEFFRQLEAKGAEVNAFTTRDYTVYYENFTPDLLPKVVDMEADRLGHLKLDEEIIETEKAVVLEERKLRVDSSPGGQMQEAIWTLAYRRHPYQWPVIGYPSDISGMSSDQIRDYFHEHYVASNATVVIVGDFDSDRTFELIKKAYADLPKKARPERKVKTEPEQTEERRLTLYDQVASERFTHAYHVTSAEDDDSYALDVLANILFEGTSSRAWRRLVEEKDLVASIGGSAYTPTYPGLFIISATMKGALGSEVAEAELDRVIRQVQEQEVTQDEIRAAVKQLTVHLVDSVRTPYGLGQLLGTVVTILGEPERFAEDLAKYTQVTAKDVKRVAAQYLIPNNRSVVIMAPESKRHHGGGK